MQTKYMKIMMFIIAVALSLPAFTQSSLYQSSADREFTIQNVGVINLSDNVKGIYSTPTNAELKRLLQQDPQWSEVDTAGSQNIQQIIQLKPNTAALGAKIIAGSGKGLDITLTLYSGSQGRPLAQAQSANFSSFDIPSLLKEIQKLYSQVKRSVPYSGVILSRKGQQVTLNIGSQYGLKAGSSVSVLHILKANRHPKHDFVTSTEKEVLGRIKLSKVESNLSFGYVELEKEINLIQAGAKVIPDEFVVYSTPVTSSDGKILHDIQLREDKEIAFGKDPQEWTPVSAPQYGFVEVMAGIGGFKFNNDITPATGYSTKSDFTPQLALRGEIWMNPEWNLNFGIRQAIFNLNNNMPGSTPGDLNATLSQYNIHLGYNLLLTDDYFGPKMNFGIGFIDSNFKIDDSNPLAYPSTKYGGLALKVGGTFPIDEQIPVDIGANLDFYLNTQSSESPNRGGTSSNALAYSFFGEYKYKTRVRLKGEIMFENFNMDVSSGTDKIENSQQLTTLWFGLKYLF